MSLYTERDPVKLREIAVALCVETAKRSSTHTSAQLTRVAEETVPPVPTSQQVSDMTFDAFDVRGFVGFRFEDRYGEKCSVQESSLATENAIWFGIDNPVPKRLVQNEGWMPIDLGPGEVLVSGRMHLTQDQVKALLPTLQHFAERGALPPEAITYAPVPAPEPEYHTYKGVTYQDDRWVDVDGEAWLSASACINGNSVQFDGDKQEALTDDDHAALMALKANPVKVAPTPATVASEPECIAALRRACNASVVVLTDVWDSRIAYGTEILDAYDNKPATEAEALALLVKLGYTQETVNINRPDVRPLFRNVLIAPEGE